MTIHAAHLIFFVSDQERSAQFYEHILDLKPALHVPGMTEFHVSEGCILGLMPTAGARRLLGASLPALHQDDGAPTAELYLQVDAPGEYYQRALQAGATSISPLEARNWGHMAAYVLDPDGHIVAFAKAI